MLEQAKNRVYMYICSRENSYTFKRSPPFFIPHRFLSGLASIPEVCYAATTTGRNTKSNRHHKQAEVSHGNTLCTGSPLVLPPSSTAARHAPAANTNRGLACSPKPKCFNLSSRLSRDHQPTDVPRTLYASSRRRWRKVRRPSITT